MEDLWKVSGSDFESFLDDGCLFIDQSSGRAAVTPFEALTAGSDDGGDFGDAEYETQMRKTLHALLDQADAELYNEGGESSASTECRRWRRGFCHLAVRGHAAPVSVDHASAAAEPASSSSRVADYCVLPVPCATASLELELVGRQCVPTPPQPELEWDEDEAPPAHVEDVLAWHGVHEETLAAHVTGGPDAAAAGRREWSRLRRFGLPPREPALALVDNVLSRLVQACWRALQPVLAKVPLVTARVLARLAPPPHAESPPPAMAHAAPAPCQLPSGLGASPAPPQNAANSWASGKWSPLAPERAAAAAAAACEPPLGTCAAVALGGLRQTFAAPAGTQCGSCTVRSGGATPTAGLRPRVLPAAAAAARAVPPAARLPRGSATPWSAQEDVARMMMPVVGSRCSRPVSSTARGVGAGGGGGGSGGGGGRGGSAPAWPQQGQPVPRAARSNSLAPSKRFSPSVNRRASSGSAKPSGIDDGLRLPPISLFGRGYSS